MFQLAIKSKSPFIFVVGQKRSQPKYFAQCETWPHRATLPDKRMPNDMLFINVINKRGRNVHFDIRILYQIKNSFKNVFVVKLDELYESRSSIRADSQ